MLTHDWSEIPMLISIAFIKSVQSACRCHFYKVRGSLIPQPSINAGVTVQIGQRAVRITKTLRDLRITIFQMTEIWRLHAKTDIQKRLASVHSKVRRGSLIPQPSIDVRGADQIKQQAKTVIMILKNFPKGCHQYDGQLEIQTCRRGLPMSTQL